MHNLEFRLTHCSIAETVVRHISLESASDGKVKCEYAVRGKILDRAMEVEKVISPLLFYSFAHTLPRSGHVNAIRAYL